MRQFVENKVQKERIIEARTMGITSMLKDHGVLAGHGKSDLRVEGLRRERAQDKERRAQISEMEARLASELEQRKARDVRVDMDKKRICDSSEELRALKE